MVALRSWSSARWHATRRSRLRPDSVRGIERRDQAAAGRSAALLAAGDPRGARSVAESALTLATDAAGSAEALLLLGEIAWVESPGRQPLEYLESALAHAGDDRRLRGGQVPRGHRDGAAPFAQPRCSSPRHTSRPPGERRRPSGGAASGRSWYDVAKTVVPICVTKLSRRNGFGGIASASW